MKGKFEPMHSIQITEEGVTKLLKNLNPHKAPGPDNITPRVLKELATHISPILTIIFRKSYNTGEIPSICKRAFVCPIFKKGKKFEAINYHPVSLIFSFSYNFSLFYEFRSLFIHGYPSLFFAV